MIKFTGLCENKSHYIMEKYDFLFMENNRLLRFCERYLPRKVHRTIQEIAAKVST
jgi:hypothetical protein